MNSDLLQKVVDELIREALIDPKLIQDKISELAVASINFGPSLVSGLVDSAHEKLTKKDAASQTLLLEMVSRQQWFSKLLSNVSLSFMLIGMKYQEAAQFEGIIEK